MIDYIATDEKLRKDVLDAKVVREMFEESDHYTVLAKMKIIDGSMIGIMLGGSK